MDHALVDQVLCTHCGHAYDEAKGCVVQGIPADTAWESVPSDWLCPDCGAAKSCFESPEIVYLMAYSALTGF